MRPDDVGSGGFDSHTLPPAAARAVARSAVCAAALLMCVAAPARAQKPDSGAVARGADSANGPQGATRALKPFAPPPVSARRAFVYSALIPGMGQAALDRKYAGATFFLIEAMSWALVRRSADDERIAKSFLGDSVPAAYAIDPVTGLAQRDSHGNPVVSVWSQSRYSADLVRARALHVEDWVAIILFNHLFSGADAYVAANLWDLPEHLPQRLRVRAMPLVHGGVAMIFSLSVR